MVQISVDPLAQLLRPLDHLGQLDSLAPALLIEALNFLVARDSREGLGTGVVNNSNVASRCLTPWKGTFHQANWVHEIQSVRSFHMLVSYRVPGTWNIVSVLALLLLADESAFALLSPGVK